jgi:hypothetical protein
VIDINPLKWLGPIWERLAHGRQHAEIAKHWAEIAKGRGEIADGRAELAKSRDEVTKDRAQLDREKTELADREQRRGKVASDGKNKSRESELEALKLDSEKLRLENEKLKLDNENLEREVKLRCEELERGVRQHEENMKRLSESLDRRIQELTQIVHSLKFPGGINETDIEILGAINRETAVNKTPMLVVLSGRLGIDLNELHYRLDRLTRLGFMIWDQHHSETSCSLSFHGRDLLYRTHRPK